MRNGHGLPVACSAPPPQTTVATNSPDGSQQTNQDEGVSFEKNDEVEEDSDSKLVASRQKYQKTVSTSAGIDAKVMMPPSEETNTASSAAQNTYSDPNISSAQCVSTHSVKDSDIKLSSSVVNSAAIKDLLTSTLFNVNTKSILHGDTGKPEKEKNIAKTEGTESVCFPGNKLLASSLDCNNFDSVKNKVQLISSVQLSEDLNNYTDISSVSSEGLSSNEDSGNEDDSFEKFVVNDVGAINLVKGECSKVNSSDGSLHQRSGWTAKPSVFSQIVADESIQSAPLCLTVNKRPETQVEPAPVKNYGVVLKQPSTFRHVSNPVSYSAFAPKYPVQLPVLHIPFHSSGFRGSSITDSESARLRNVHFGPQVQRSHTSDTNFSYDSDSDDLTSSDSDSSKDDPLPVFNRLQSSLKMDGQQTKQQDLASKMLSSAHCDVQKNSSFPSPVEIAPEDASVPSKLCSASTNVVQSVVNDGNVKPNSANVEKCSEPSSNEKLLDNTIPAADCEVQNFGSSKNVQLDENSGSENKIDSKNKISSEHCNGYLKLCEVSTQNLKKTKPRRLNIAKVSSAGCSRKKASKINHVQSDTQLSKRTCSKLNIINGCHGLCAAKKGPNKDIGGNIDHMISSNVNINSENEGCILAVGEGTCQNVTTCSTRNEALSEVCDSTSCSSHELREEALKVVTHCLKDLIFRVVSFPNKSTFNAAVTTGVSLKESENPSSKELSVERETSFEFKSNKKLYNNAAEQVEKNEEKCNENHVSSTCIDANYQCSDKSTKGVQVEMKNDEPSMLGEILHAALIPNIINATKCFLNHECEISTRSLGLLDGNKLLANEDNSQKLLCMDSSQHCTSVSLCDSSNSSTKHISLDKSCEINLSDFEPCHQKFSIDDITLARNVKEKCLMIQRSLNRNTFGNNSAMSKKNGNFVFARTSSVTGVTCSLPLSKVSLALADCVFAADTACVQNLKYSNLLPVDYSVASVDSHSSRFEFTQAYSRDGVNSLPNVMFDDIENAQLHCATLNSSVKSVSSSAQTDVTYKNTFPSSTDVPSKFLFQVQPVHHMKLGDGQKLYACDICSGVYQRSFSLKRHYLRSHINYCHLTDRDISNCGIVVGDKMAVQTGTNTKIYMQNSKITFQLSVCGNYEPGISKSVPTDFHPGCIKSSTVTRSDPHESDVKSEIVANNSSVCATAIKPSFKSVKEAKSIHFPALYRCHFCGICFDEKEHLKLHLLNHPPPVTGTGKETNSYVCDVCSLNFTHKHNYLRHCASENHKNASKPRNNCVKEHLCLYCDKGFKTSAIRKRHQSRIHHYFSKQKKPGKRPFHPCSYCPSTAHKFKDLTVLVKHMIASHPDKYYGCLACSERFDCNDAYNNHVNIYHKKNKSKHLKGTELKEAKSTHTPLQNDVHKEGDELPNVLVTVQKTNSEEHTKTQTKKTPDKKSRETVKEHSLNEDSNNDSPKQLNCSNINGEFRYTCGVCQKMFTNYVNMCRHRRLAHGTITAKNKKVKKSITSKETSDMCSSSTSGQSSSSRSESPAVASKAPADVSNKTQGTAQMVPPASLHESQMDPETLFYSKIAINIRDNLLNHLDGKLIENSDVTINHPVSTSTSTSSLTSISSIKENKALYERSIATDRPKRGEKGILKVEYLSNNLQMKDLVVDEQKQSTSGEKSKLSGRRGHIHKVPWEKYNFPKNYDGKGDGLASYIKDMSHLDISTQLVMQQNLQRLNNSAGDKCKDSLSDCLENEGSIQDTDFPKGLRLVQRNFSNVLSDIFSTSRHEPTLKRACSSSSVPSLLNCNDALVNVSHSNLTRRKSLSDIKIQSPTGENHLGRPVNDGSSKDVELSGEWVRPRSYICGACSERFVDLYDLEEHKFIAHPNVWCTHFEFEECTITGTSFDNSKCHSSFPGNLSRRYLNATGTLQVAEVAPSTASVDSQCTKCSKNFSSLPELHRHILDCGGDTTWMLTMVAAASSGNRRNRKWRPFGSRRRRHQGRRGMKRNIPSSPIKLPQYRVRHRGTDSDSIQRMIANLPAKRASRRVIQFNEDEVKTRSQGTVHCNRILRKRFKVSNFVTSMHHHKSWSSRSSGRGLTVSQRHKLSSKEARSSRAAENIRWVSSESTASKLLRSSKNLLQNKQPSRAVKNITRSLLVHHSQPTCSTLPDKDHIAESSAPKGRIMSAKKTQDHIVTTLSSMNKVKRRSRFVRKSVINNIKSKYRNSVSVLSGAETLSDRYRSARKMLQRKVIKHVPSLSPTKEQKHVGKEIILPRRSGRTSVLREKVKANATMHSIDKSISKVGESNVVNSCKLTSQMSSADNNIGSEKKIVLEDNVGEQTPTNKENIILEKRTKKKIITVGSSRTKTKVLKVPQINKDKHEINAKVCHKPCSVICDINFCPPSKVKSPTQDRVASNVPSSQNIPTPRTCVACGKHFKVVGTLEKHLEKCRNTVHKCKEKINCKSKRYSTKTVRNDDCKIEVAINGETDEKMPELQKEEPLEVLPITESSKKNDDLTNDIPVLSPVLDNDVIGKINAVNEEYKCRTANIDGIKNKRKSKRGQKILLSNEVISNSEKNENSEHNPSADNLGRISLTKETKLKDEINVSGSHVSTEDLSDNIKEMQVPNGGMVVLPNISQIALNSPSDVVPSDMRLAQASSRNKINIAAAQRTVKIAKKKENMSKKKQYIEKNIKKVLNIRDNYIKQSKEIKSKGSDTCVTDSVCVSKTDIVLDGMKNQCKNNKGKQEVKKVKGQIKHKVLGIKRKGERNFTCLRSSKRLSKATSGNLDVENGSDSNTSFMIKKEKFKKCHHLKPDFIIEQDLLCDKNSTSLVQCCNESKSKCKCSSLEILQMPEGDKIKILTKPADIELTSKSLKTHFSLDDDKQTENIYTKTTSMFTEKIESKKPVETSNVMQNYSAMNVSVVMEDIGEKGCLKSENPSNVRNEKFDESSENFSESTDHAPNLLNELNNGPSCLKKNVQLGLKNRHQAFPKKKCKKVANVCEIKTNKTLRELLTAVKKNSRLDNFECKNDENCYTEKLEKYEKTSQNVNISDVKTDALNTSDVVPESLVASADDCMKEGTFDTVSAVVHRKIQGTENKISKSEESLESGVTKEQCEYLQHESFPNSAVKNPRLKSDNWESKCGKPKFSRVSRTERRKLKFQKSKSSIVPKCTLSNKRLQHKNNIQSVKSFEENVAVKSFPSALTNDNIKASCTAAVKNKGSAEMESFGLPISDTTNKIGHTQVDPLSSPTNCEFQTCIENGGTKSSSFTDPIFIIGSKYEHDTVNEVLETSENVSEKSKVTVMLDNFIDTARGDRFVSSSNIEQKSNVSIATMLNYDNIEGGKPIKEVLVFSESSLDADEDTVPIAKLREINLCKIRNLHRLSKSKKSQVKKCRKQKSKTAEIKHLEIKTTGSLPDVTNSHCHIVSNTDSGNCFAKLEEETKLHAKDDVDVSSGQFKSEEHLSLSGNRLLRARRNNSSDKNVLSQIEKRESRARSTRWNLSYEEMYTSSDIASEADSQDFDSNQKENKSVLRGHHRRKSRRMRTAKPRNNFLRQEKKRRKSLRRLTVLRNQRKAEMRLVNKARKSGDISVPKTLVGRNVEVYSTNVKMILAEDIFNPENCNNTSSQKCLEIVTDSATEEKKFSEITKTAVINKVFCKKPKKNSLCEVKVKEKNNATINSKDGGNLHNVLLAANLKPSVEGTFSSKVSSHQNPLFCEDNCKTTSLDYINVEKGSSNEICETDVLRVVEKEPSNSAYVVKEVQKVPRTSVEKKTGSYTTVKHRNLQNMFVKNEGSKEIEGNIFQKRKKPKKKDSMKKHIYLLNQVSSLVSEQSVATSIRISNNINKVQLDYKLLQHKNGESTVQNHDYTQSLEIPGSKNPEQQDSSILSDAHFILDKILEVADFSAKEETQLVCTHSEVKNKFLKGSEFSEETQAENMPLEEGNVLLEEGNVLQEEGKLLQGEGKLLQGEGKLLLEGDVLLEGDDMLPEGDDMLPEGGVLLEEVKIPPEEEDMRLEDEFLLPDNGNMSLVRENLHPQGITLSSAACAILESRCFSDTNLNCPRIVQPEMIVGTVSPHLSVQQQLGVSEGCCDTALEESTKTSGKKESNDYIFKNSEQKEFDLKYSHYCSICRKYYSSSSNLIKHKLSVFHKKNVSLAGLGYEASITAPADLIAFRRGFSQQQPSMVSGRIETKELSEDGTGASSCMAKSSDLMLMFSDEIPLSIIAKHMGNGRHTRRMHKKHLGKTNFCKKKTTAKNNDKFKETLGERKKKLIGKFKRKLRRRGFVKSHVVDKEGVSDATGLHENYFDHKTKPSPSLSFFDNTVNVTSTVERDANSVYGNSTVANNFSSEEQVEVAEPMSFGMDSVSNLPPQSTVCKTLISDHDTSESEPSGVVPEKCSFQPLSLAVLASRNMRENVSDSINRTCVTSVTSMKYASVKSISTSPSSLKELCLDPILLSEVEIQSTVQSDKFCSEPSTLLDHKKQLTPPNSDSDCNCKEQITFCEAPENIILSTEAEIPILHDAHIRDALLGEIPVECSFKKVEKLTWSDLPKIKVHESCEEQNIPINLSEGEATLSLDLEGDDSTITKDSSKMVQDKKVLSSQLSTPDFLKPEIKQSLQEMTSNLEAVKHLPKKLEKSDAQLNFLQMYDEHANFVEEFESGGILLEQQSEGILLEEPIQEQPAATTDIFQSSESEEKSAIQKLMLEEDDRKLSATQYLEDKEKTVKAYKPEKLQVQLPLLKIRDVQFLLLHHADIQKTTYEDFDSQQSLSESSDVKNCKEHKTVNVTSELKEPVHNQIENEILSDATQTELEQPKKKKCDQIFNSLQEGQPSTLEEYQKHLCIPYETIPQVSEVKKSKLCVYENEHPQQETTLFNCAASLLIPEDKLSQVNTYVSQMSVQQEPSCNEVVDIPDTLAVQNVQESSPEECNDIVVSLKQDELVEEIETSAHLTSDVNSVLLKNTISVSTEAVTQPQDYNMHLSGEAQSLPKQLEPSKDEILHQDCEIMTAVDEMRQSNDEENLVLNSLEICIPMQEAGDSANNSLLKCSHSEVLSHKFHTVCNTEENKLWEHQNNVCKHDDVGQLQIDILGNDSSWSQNSNKCLINPHLPREKICGNSPILHESLCEPVFPGPHKEFEVNPTLTASEISKDTVCTHEDDINEPSDHIISSQSLEMSQNLPWSQKSDTTQTVSEKSSVEEHELEYSSLHRLAEVVIWSQNNTASPVLESTLCQQTKHHEVIKMTNNAWSHKVDSQSVVHDNSQHTIHETSVPENHVNWTQKEIDVNIVYQNPSREQSDVCSSLTKIPDSKVAWSQNNEMCLPVLPEYSCEQIHEPPLKDPENSYTWSQSHEVHMSVLQNLADEHCEPHPSSLQIPDNNVALSRENENCLSVLQTLSNEQNVMHHSPITISHNLNWPHVHKPGCSLNQLCECGSQQPAVEVPSTDVTWSQKEDIGATALGTISLVKERIKIMTTKSQVAQPQTSETYTFSHPSDECNIHQTSYPDPEFDVCLPHHQEVLASAQQEYAFENVDVHPQLQSPNSRNLPLHEQGSYTPIHQSPSSEGRPTISEVQSSRSVLQESTANDFANQFSSLGTNSMQVPGDKQELKELPPQLLKLNKVGCSLPQKAEVNAELLKEPTVPVPLQAEARAQVESHAKLTNSEMQVSSDQDCNQELGYQVDNATWCGRESGNWPNEQIQNSSGWSGQSEIGTNSGWTEWVNGNMNWSQQTAPQFYSTTPVPAGGSLGSIIDSVNQILNEDNTGGTNSSHKTPVPSDYNGYETLPAACVVPRGLEELQRAMGATDEEMLMLQKLGENCCWPLENAEIMDLDGHKQAPEKDNTSHRTKETDKIPVNSQPLENTTKKPVVSVSRRQRAEDRPFGSHQNILTQYESKEMVCPVCNKHFLGLTALQKHVTSAHNLDQATDRKAKVTERSRQALISSIACTSFLQMNSSRHMCTTCKELHVDEESLQQHIVAMHGEGESAAATEESQEPGGSINVNAQNAKGLKSHMSSALGGLLNRALSTAFITRLSKEILARSEVDSSVESPEHGGTERSQGMDVGREKLNQQLKGDSDNTKEKQYVCDLCEMKFYYLGSKNRHVQTVHLKMPRNLLGEIVPDSSVSSTSDGNSKEEEHENESAWMSESPPEWTAEPNMDGEILDGSFLCQDCGINFQTPQEVLSHRQLEHPPLESQLQNVSDGNKKFLAGDKTVLVDSSNDTVIVPESVDGSSNSVDSSSICADGGNRSADGLTSVMERSLSAEEVPTHAAAPSKLSSQMVSEKTVEKLLFSSCLGRMSEVAARKAAKSKIDIEELEKELCRNDAIIKAKAEAAIRELSLTRKGRNSAANTRWGVQRYKFIVPDRHPSNDKTKEKVVLPAEDRYSYPLIRKVSNSRFASLTERKKKLGSKLESLPSDKSTGKEKLEKDITEPDSTSVDVYEFDDDDAASKEISLRNAALPIIDKDTVQAEGNDSQIIIGKDSVSDVETCVQIAFGAKQGKTELLPCVFTHEKVDVSPVECTDEVQQQVLGIEIPYSDKNVSSEENVTNENRDTSLEHESVMSFPVIRVVNEVFDCAEKQLHNDKVVGERGEKLDSHDHGYSQSSLQKVSLELKDTSSPAKSLGKNKKSSKVNQKRSFESMKDSKPKKLQKKRKVNDSFEMPSSKHTSRTDSSKPEIQEVISLGRRQVKKVSYVELYDSEVDEQFLFYSDDEVQPVEIDVKPKPKCKIPKKKQSKPDKKKRKSDQLVGQEVENCSSETVSHVHKKRCKQKSQSVDVGSSSSSGVSKGNDLSETRRTDSLVVETNKFQPKWLCASEPVTDEDNTSESDQSDKHKTTKTDLLKTVFAKSRRNSTTIVSGSGGSIPDVDDGRTNASCVKHKHRS